MATLTQADRDARAARLAYCRRHGIAIPGEDRAGSPYPDALTDPVGFLEALEADRTAELSAEIGEMYRPTPTDQEARDALIRDEVDRLARLPKEGSR